jgi:phosphate transport system substrate-binding protein
MHRPLTALTAVLLLALATPAIARDQIWVAGSSTVFPFAAAAAEQFSKASKFKAPLVESIGTGGGFKLFCSGVGAQYSDISTASRAIKASEIELCKKNGVTQITEVKIGFDGIVLASSKAAPRLKLTKRQLFLALAKTVPQGGKLVANPYRAWRDIDGNLPATRIEVMGPPPTSGTRDAFVELVMEAACQGIPEIDSLKADAKAHATACKSVREDGAFIDSGENDNLIVQKLVVNPQAHGIFGFSFLDANLDKIQGNPIDGVEPVFETIAAGTYGVARPIFIYVKNAHAGVVPGIREFLAEFTSDKAMGNDGYLARDGLIPLPDGERKDVKQRAAKLQALAM